MQLALESGPALGSEVGSARRWHGPAGALAVHLAIALLWLAWPAAPPPAGDDLAIEMVLAPPPPPEAPPPPAAIQPEPPPPAAPAAPAKAAAPPKPSVRPAPVAAPLAPAAAPSTAAPAAATDVAAPAAPPPAAAPAPITSAPPAEPDIAPRPADAPKPAYPRAARQRGWQGVVLVLVRVAEDGIPLDVALKESSGHPMLDEAAIEAVRHWRFTPARQSGRAVTAAVEVPVRFSLEG